MGFRLDLQLISGLKNPTRTDPGGQLEQIRWPTVPQIPRDPAVEECAQGRASYGGMVGSVGLTAGCQARRGVLCVIRRIAKKASQYTNAGPPKLMYTYPTPKHSVYPPPSEHLSLGLGVSTPFSTPLFGVSTHVSTPLLVSQHLCLNISFGVSTPPT